MGRGFWELGGFVNKLLLIMFITVIFLAGCVQTSKVVCNDPYLMVGDSCCLDKDANEICDSDETVAVECEEVALDFVSDGGEGISINKAKVGEEARHKDWAPEELVDGHLSEDGLSVGSRDL